jgi:hypothetical protein
MLLVLWGENKLEHPFADSGECVVDSQGRSLCLGILPGILSLMISTLSILKGCLELSEGKSWKDKIHALIYAACNISFRLPSISLAILFYNEWAVALLIPVLICNLLLIVRYEKVKRKQFSIVTSVVISTLSPFVTCDQANLYQRVDLERSFVDSDQSAKYRKQLSASLSMLTSPLFFVSDLVLLLLLKYNKEFTYSKSIVLEKETTIYVLMTFILPMGAVTMISNFLYGMSTARKPISVSNYYAYGHVYRYFSGALASKFKFCLQHVGFLFVLIVVFVASGSAISTIGMSEVSSNLGGKCIV